MSTVTATAGAKHTRTDSPQKRSDRSKAENRLGQRLVPILQADKDRGIINRPERPRHRGHRPRPSLTHSIAPICTGVRMHCLGQDSQRELASVRDLSWR